MNQSENWAWADPHSGAIVWVRGETLKTEPETADLWQPKCNENQTALATAIHMLGRNAGLLEGAVAGSWCLGIVEQSQCDGCCWLWRDRTRGGDGWDRDGKSPVEESQAAMEARWYSWVTRRGWSHHHSLSLSTCQHRQLNNIDAGPSNAWRTELQSRTRPRVPL